MYVYPQSQCIIMSVEIRFIYLYTTQVDSNIVGIELASTLVVVIEVGGRGSGQEWA